MADMVQTQKKIALLHRHAKNRIQETNAAFPYLEAKGIDVLTFKRFDRGTNAKFWKSLAWVFYAPFLVIGKGYDVIYCDDSFPFYPALVKLVCPGAKVVIRLGDLHLMYYVSGILYSFLHFFECIGWACADEIIAISQVMADYVFEEVGKKPLVVLDPVNVEQFAKKAPCDGSVMFHGLLTKNKNVDLLLGAARRLPDVSFNVLGFGPDYDRLKSLAPRNVHFRGWVPFGSIHDHIASCEIGVALRSDNRGNEYVVTSPFLQYGAAGKPCLVTRRRVFGDYQWQFSGVDELVSKIQYFLSMPPKLRIAEGKKLQDFIIKNHEANKIGEEIWSALSF